MTKKEIDNLRPGREMDCLVCVALGWHRLTDKERAILEGVEKSMGLRQFDEFNLPHIMKSPSNAIRPALAISSSAWDAVALFIEFAPKYGWALTHAVSAQYGEGWFIVDNNEYDFLSLSGCAALTMEHAIAKAVLLLQSK